MYVSVKPNNKVNIKCIKTHTHSLSFEQSKFLPIPTNIQTEIATMLSLGIPINTVLDNIRQSFVSRDTRNNTDKIKSFHLIDRKTIHNIKQTIVSSSVIRHSNDAKSVYLRVESLKQEKYNPVVLFKPQFALDSSSRLRFEDFMLVLMTEQQLSINKQFADRILCMDSTHKTNQYSFKLITL